MDPSEGHLHAGDLGDVTFRGGTVTSPPPLPHRPLPVDHPPLTGPNMEDNLPDRRQPHGITVNGIPLMDLLKNKKGDEVKKTPGRQKNNKNKNITSSTTPQATKITRYFENKKHEEDIKKQEDKNGIDNKNEKKTFSSTADSMRKRSISEKIKSFEVFQNGGEAGECIMGSGRCATHHTKLVREVKNKRTSFVNKVGEIEWKIREGTILVCPVAGRKLLANENTVVVPPLTELGSTNKKQKTLDIVVKEMNGPITAFAAKK